MIYAVSLNIIAYANNLFLILSDYDSINNLLLSIELFFPQSILKTIFCFGELLGIKKHKFFDQF